MNIISQLRQRVRENGKAEITLEEFNQLQSEWIIRAGFTVPTPADKADYIALLNMAIMIGGNLNMQLDEIGEFLRQQISVQEPVAQIVEPSNSGVVPRITRLRPLYSTDIGKMLYLG